MPQDSDDGSDLAAFLKKQGRYDKKWDKPAPAAPAAPKAAAPAAPTAPVGTAPVTPPAATEQAEPSQPGAITRGLEWLDRNIAGGSPMPPGQKPEDEDLGWQTAMGRGIAKGGAKTAGQLAHLEDWLGRKVAPNMTEMAEQHIPQFVQDKWNQLQEFGAAPSTSFAESAGEVAGENLPYAFTPAVAEKAIAGGLARVLPQTTRMVIPGARAAVRVPAWGAKAAKLGGKAAGAVESAGYGALGGALEDPDDPVHGAEVGAAAGAIPGAASGLLRSQIAHYAAGHGLPAVGSTGAYMALTAMGVPHTIAHLLAIPNIRWIRSPLGRTLHHVGEHLIDEFGRIVAVLPRGTAGAQAEKYLGGDQQ